jgi:predicted nucleotidyltransferase
MMRLEPDDTAFQIFAYLALHEGEAATMTQLARMVGRSERVAWSALKGLAEDDHVIVEDKPKGSGYGRLYRVNPRHAIFPELRQIAFKMLGGTGALRDLILLNPAVDAAAIFGSVAAGSDRRTGRLSDIDLLVIFAEESTREERIELRSAVSALSERLNRVISVEGLLRSEWEQGKQDNRVLKRIASGDLLVLKGSIGA